MNGRRLRVLKKERLIELVNRLPADARLSTTPEFEQATGCFRLVNASIIQTSDLVIALGYQDHGAALSVSGKTIKVFSSCWRTPISAFTVAG